MKKNGFRVKLGFFGKLAIIDKVAAFAQTAPFSPFGETGLNSQKRNSS